MGHTVYPMRSIIYSKIFQIRKLCRGLREPQKSAAENLLYNIYQGISAISYANPLPQYIEDNMIFTILIQEKLKNSAEIDDLTLLILSVMIRYKTSSKKTSNNPDEIYIHRLLPKR